MIGRALFKLRPSSHFRVPAHQHAGQDQFAKGLALPVDKYLFRRLIVLLGRKGEEVQIGY